MCRASAKTLWWREIRNVCTREYRALLTYRPPSSNAKVCEAPNASIFSRFLPIANPRRRRIGKIAATRTH
jgi:hypothetical protein